MQQIVDKLMEEHRKQKDQKILDDIIDIYNGKYKNYDEYQKAIAERDKPTELPYSMIHVVIPDLFYYLMEKKENENNN